MKKMIQLAEKLYLEPRPISGPVRLYTPIPGGIGSRRIELTTREMRIVAYELLAHAARRDMAMDAKAAAMAAP